MRSPPTHRGSQPSLLAPILPPMGQKVGAGDMRFAGKELFRASLDALNRRAHRAEADLVPRQLDQDLAASLQTERLAKLGRQAEPAGWRHLGPCQLCGLVSHSWLIR